MNSSDVENGDGNEYGLDASPNSANNDIGMAGAGEGKTAGQPLSDFLLQLEDYIPTVRNCGQSNVFSHFQILPGICYLTFLLHGQLHGFIIN
jgi:hypothetical protein